MAKARALTRLSDRLKQAVEDLDVIDFVVRESANELYDPLQSNYPIRTRDLDTAMAIATANGDAIPGASIVTRYARPVHHVQPEPAPDLRKAWLASQHAVNGALYALRRIGYRTPWHLPSTGFPVDPATFLAAISDAKAGLRWAEPQSEHLTSDRRRDLHDVCTEIAKALARWPEQTLTPAQQPKLRYCACGCGRLLGDRRGAYAGVCANKRTQAKKQAESVA